jgi:hypothetical protein
MIKKARKKRDDIINNLPYRGQKIISDKIGCSQSYISTVLMGIRDSSTLLSEQILMEAEMLAAVNIWQNKYCKFESTLNYPGIDIKKDSDFKRSLLSLLSEATKKIKKIQ